jgi:tartrate dehydratase beta subunit/fumarate hydratase class I family protein
MFNQAGTILLCHHCAAGPTNSSQEIGFSKPFCSRNRFYVGQGLLEEQSSEDARVRKGDVFIFVTGIPAYFVLGNLPVITNVSNTFCPSRAAS